MRLKTEINLYESLDTAVVRLEDLAKNANDISINDIRAEILEIKNLLDAF